jgi:hypothetical protein
MLLVSNKGTLEIYGALFIKAKVSNQNNNKFSMNAKKFLMVLIRKLTINCSKDFFKLINTESMASRLKRFFTLSHLPRS